MVQTQGSSALLTVPEPGVFTPPTPPWSCGARTERAGRRPGARPWTEVIPRRPSPVGPRRGWPARRSATGTPPAPAASPRSRSNAEPTLAGRSPDHDRPDQVVRQHLAPRPTGPGSDSPGSSRLARAGPTRVRHHHDRPRPEACPPHPRSHLADRDRVGPLVASLRVHRAGRRRLLPHRRGGRPCPGRSPCGSRPRDAPRRRAWPARFIAIFSRIRRSEIDMPGRGRPGFLEIDCPKRVE